MSLPHIHRISFMAVHVGLHHFSTLLNSFSFSLSAQNLSFSQVFPTMDWVRYLWTLDCLLGLRLFFGLIMLIGLFYFLIIIYF